MKSKKYSMNKRSYEKFLLEILKKNPDIYPNSLNF